MKGYTFLGIAAVCVVALFASGGLMSAGRLDYAWMRAIHRIAPAALIIALALVFALLSKICYRATYSYPIRILDYQT